MTHASTNPNSSYQKWFPSKVRNRSLHKLAPPPPSRHVVKSRAQALPLHQNKPPASLKLQRSQVSLNQRISEAAARPPWTTTTGPKRKSKTEQEQEAGRSTRPHGRSIPSGPHSPQPHHPLPAGPALPALPNLNPAKQLPTSHSLAKPLLNPLLPARSVPPETLPTKGHLLTARSTRNSSLSCPPRQVSAWEEAGRLQHQGTARS